MYYIKPLYSFLRDLLFWPLREFFPGDKNIILLNAYIIPTSIVKKNLFEFLAIKNN
jgi:hypothetical protein